MKRQIYVTQSWVLAAAFLLALPSATLAQNSNGSGEKSQSKTSGNPATTLARLELSMQQTAGERRESICRAQGEYWSIIDSQKDFPRAYNFFSQFSVCPSLYSRCSGTGRQRDWRLYRLAVFAGCR